jgi:hypothetical protein
VKAALGLLFLVLSRMREDDMWIKNTDLMDIARAALEQHDNIILALRIIHDEHADYDIQPGEYCRPSYRWEDGECTDEVLSGTSAIDARMLLGYRGAPTSYYGDRVLVITGSDQVRGEDDCEVVINDAIVLVVSRFTKASKNTDI